MPRAIDLSISSEDDSDDPTNARSSPPKSKYPIPVDAQLSFPDEDESQEQQQQPQQSAASRNQPRFRNIHLSGSKSHKKSTTQNSKKSSSSQKKTPRRRSSDPPGTKNRPSQQKTSKQQQQSQQQSQSKQDPRGKRKKAHVIAALASLQDTDDSDSDHDNDNDASTLSDQELSQPLNYFANATSSPKRTRTRPKQQPQPSKSTKYSSSSFNDNQYDDDDDVQVIVEGSATRERRRIPPRPRSKQKSTKPQPRRRRTDLSSATTRKKATSSKEQAPLVKPLRRRPPQHPRRQTSRNKSNSKNNAQKQHSSHTMSAAEAASSSSSSSSSEDEALDPRPKDILKAGDAISYYNPVFVHGNPNGFRKTSILEIAGSDDEDDEEDPYSTRHRRRRRRRRKKDPTDWFPLTLANGEVIPADTRVTRLMTGRVRAIEEFTLLPGKVAKGSITTRQERVHQILQSVRTAAANIPEHLQELKRSSDNSQKKDDDTDNNTTSQHDTLDDNSDQEETSKETKNDLNSTSHYLSIDLTTNANTPPSMGSRPPLVDLARSASSKKPMNNLPFSLSATASSSKKAPGSSSSLRGLLHSSKDNANFNATNDEDSEVATVIPTPFSAPSRSTSAKKNSSARRKEHGQSIPSSSQKNRPIRLFQQATPTRSSLEVPYEKDEQSVQENSLVLDTSTDSPSSQKSNKAAEDNTPLLSSTDELMKKSIVRTETVGCDLVPSPSQQKDEAVATNPPSTLKGSLVQSPKKNTYAAENLDRKNAARSCYYLSSSQSSQSLESLLKDIQPTKAKVMTSPQPKTKNKKSDKLESSTTPTGRSKPASKTLDDSSDEELDSPRRRGRVPSSTKSKKTKAVYDSSDDSSKDSRKDNMPDASKVKTKTTRKASSIDDILEDSESDLDVTFLRAKKNSSRKSKPTASKPTTRKPSLLQASLEDRLWDDDLQDDWIAHEQLALPVAEVKQTQSRKSDSTRSRKRGHVPDKPDKLKARKKKRKSEFGARAEAKRRLDAVPSHVGEDKRAVDAYRLDYSDSDDELSKATSVDHRVTQSRGKKQESFSFGKRGKKAPSQSSRARQSVFNPSKLESMKNNSYDQDLGDSSSGEDENYINGKRQCILGSRTRLVRDGSVADSIRTTQSSVLSIPIERHGDTTLRNTMRMPNQDMKVQSSNSKKHRMSVESNNKKPGGAMQLEFVSRSSKARYDDDSQDSFL